MKNTIFLISLLAFASLALKTSATHAQTPNVSIYLEPSSTTVQPGGTFSLDLKVDSETQIFDTVDTFIQFDPAYIQVDSITPDTTQLPNILINSFDNTAGKVSYSTGKQLGGQDVSGIIRLATINFSTISQTPNTSLTFLFNPPLNLTEIYSQGTPVLNTSSGASITIGTPASPTPSPCLPIGNLNCTSDNIVNETDLTLLVSNFFSTIFTEGDFNSDGVINSSDVVILLSHFGQIN